MSTGTLGRHSATPTQKRWGTSMKIFAIAIETKCDFLYTIKASDRVEARQEAIYQHEQRLMDESSEHMITDVYVERIE